MVTNMGGSSVGSLLPIKNWRPITRQEWEDEFLRPIRLAQNIVRRLIALEGGAMSRSDLMFVKASLDRLEIMLTTLPMPEPEGEQHGDND